VNPGVGVQLLLELRDPTLGLLTIDLSGFLSPRNLVQKVFKKSFHAITPLHQALGLIAAKNVPTCFTAALLSAQQGV
jgi:hypothetical protein